MAKNNENKQKKTKKIMEKKTRRQDISFCGEKRALLFTVFGDYRVFLKGKGDSSLS